MPRDHAPEDAGKPRDLAPEDAGKPRDLAPEDAKRTCARGYREAKRPCTRGCQEDMSPMMPGSQETLHPRMPRGWARECCVWWCPDAISVPNLSWADEIRHAECCYTCVWAQARCLTSWKILGPLLLHLYGICISSIYTDHY